MASEATPHPGTIWRTCYWRFNRFLERHLPRGLYPRSLLIVITPIVLLQSIIALIFMDRHWESVTQRLSRSLAQDLAFVVELYDQTPKSEENIRRLVETANNTLDLTLAIGRGETLPASARPVVSLLDAKLTRFITAHVAKPFWIDTTRQDELVDIRIEVEPGTLLRVLARESRAYASNSHIFLMWMVGSSLILIWVSVLFMRNQIRPILQLAEAAQSFGMGRDVPDFHPRGAAEVQAAASAFLSMKERIERHVEQRTAMLAGVSHDLRTVLTRFKLELAFLGDSAHVRDLKRDVDEMQRMLEDYMAFVKGDGGESAEECDLRALLETVRRNAERDGRAIEIRAPEALRARIKPNAFRRCVANLVGNAMRFGHRVLLSAERSEHHVAVAVEDDGPGIPLDKRGDVFRPFVRLDHARNQDQSGTGLGLSIALDIARSHGGDVSLDDSALGGLRATVRVPV